MVSVSLMTRIATGDERLREKRVSKNKGRTRVALRSFKNHRNLFHARTFLSLPFSKNGSFDRVTAMGEKYFQSYRLTLGLIGHFNPPNFGHRHEDQGMDHSFHVKTWPICGRGREGGLRTNKMRAATGRRDEGMKP